MTVINDLNYLRVCLQKGRAGAKPRGGGQGLMPNRGMASKAAGPYSASAPYRLSPDEAASGARPSP